MKGYGAGTVFQEADGRWTAQWELPRQNGKRRRRQLRADTEAAAWKRMRESQGAAPSSPSRQPTGSVGAVGEFLDRWLRDVVARTRRERTLVGYRAIVAVLPADLRDADLHDPALGHLLQAWLNGLDRHPRTVHHYAACLRAAFTYAKRKGLMDRNPAVDLDLPAIPRVERIPLTAAEVRAFLLASFQSGDILHPLWVTAAWTGMRQGELLALRWQDVNLERASLVVRGSLARGEACGGGVNAMNALTEADLEPGNEDEDWSCIDCGIPLEPGAPPICGACVEGGG
jgi:integrase